MSVSICYMNPALKRRHKGAQNYQDLELRAQYDGPAFVFFNGHCKIIVVWVVHIILWVVATVSANIAAIVFRI